MLSGNVQYYNTALQLVYNEPAVPCSYWHFYQVSLVVGVAWQHILLISAYNKYYNNHLQTAGAKSSQQEDREIALIKQLTICNNGIFDT